jgi:hypothetical protein
MNLNEQLRKKVAARGQKEVEAFGAQYRENSRDFNASEYEKAEERVRKLYKKCSSKDLKHP